MTHLSRTTHGIAYDTTHDEIVAPNPLAAAIVIFRGGASGEEAPVRSFRDSRASYAVYDVISSFGLKLPWFPTTTSLCVSSK